MQQTNTALKATGGREASRERRARMVQGKMALPASKERSRNGERPAAVAAPAPAPVAASAPPPAAPSVAPAPAATRALSGRDASRARREALVQGKSALKQLATAAALPATPAADSTVSAVTVTPGVAGSGRMAAQALRAARARNGRGDAASARPSGRMRNPQPLKYTPKVADSRTYAGLHVTGVRIGRGLNVTGDEPGDAKQVTGTQYVGTEGGFSPREAGVKVGASRTAGGLVVTGTQVRSKIMITGDESNAALRITGEADQGIDDDVLNRREQGAYASMQFERQNNPHGHTVFGTNLGRSIRSVGSRERDRERALEKTLGGLPISGTAVGRSVRVTGDEPGSCRTITGDQYLMAGKEQSLCDGLPQGRAAAYARAGNAVGANGRPDPVTGGKVAVSETWSRQRVTGVDVEHNDQVTGDEYGVCSSLTGTPYVGPGQYDAYCDNDAAARHATPGLSAGNRVTGDTPLNAAYVTGTQRGAGRAVTGTPYYRDETGVSDSMNTLETISQRFSVRTPQRDAQLQADAGAIDAPTAESRITGSFAIGAGKITGNQEFHFSPRGRADSDAVARMRITGEGRVAGPAITGGAWAEHGNVTGTEDYIATERNPSQRAGKPHGFANATLWKNAGKHEAPKQIVTGMVGWSAKSAAKVTLSGGAQG